MVSSLTHGGCTSPARRGIREKIRCARSGILCFSNDSGRTWLTQPTVPSQVYYRSFSSSSWTDYYSLDTCWIVVWSYSSDAPLVLYDSCLISYDGGNTLQWTYRPYANTVILNLSPFRWKNSYNIFAYWKAPPAPENAYSLDSLEFLAQWQVAV